MDAAIHIGIVRSAGTSTTPQVKQIWKFASVAILVESVWLLAFGIAIHVGTPANAIHADRNAMSAWVGQVAIAGIVEAAGLHFLLIVIAMIQTFAALAKHAGKPGTAGLTMVRGTVINVGENGICLLVRRVWFPIMQLSLQPKVVASVHNSKKTKGGTSISLRSELRITIHSHNHVLVLFTAERMHGNSFPWIRV